MPYAKNVLTLKWFVPVATLLKIELNSFPSISYCRLDLGMQFSAVKVLLMYGLLLLNEHLIFALGEYTSNIHFVVSCSVNGNSWKQILNRVLYSSSCIEEEETHWFLGCDSYRVFCWICWGLHQSIGRSTFPQKKKKEKKKKKNPPVTV